jgi:methionine-rich copper-binding protein CopC
MKKILNILITSLILMNILFPFNVISQTDAKITSFTSSSYSNIQGTSAYLSLTVNTENVTSYSTLEIELTDESGNNLEEDISSNKIVVNNNTATIPLTIPANLKSGKYLLKAILNTPSLTGNSLITKTTPYTVFPSGSSDSISDYISINSIDTNSTVLVEGAISGNIIVRGTNFQNNLKTLSLKNNSTEELIYVTENIKTITSSTIEFETPKTLTKGLYKIIAKSDSTQSESISSFEVSEKSPIINSVKISDDSSLISNSINGSILLEGINFIVENESTICQIVDSNGTLISTISNANIENTSIQFDIPKNLVQGTYFVKVTSNSNSAISSDSFTIASTNNSDPSILSVKTDYQSLYENNISGNLNISGVNLYPITNINLINSNSLETYNLTTLVSENEKIQVKIPENLKAGSYLVELLISGKTIKSNAFTVLKENLVTASPSVSINNSDTISNIFSLNVGSGSLIEIKNEDSTDYSLNIENIKELAEEKKEAMTNILSINAKDEKSNNLNLDSDILKELKNNKIGINLKNEFGEIIIPPEFFTESKLNHLTITVEKIINPNFNNKSNPNLNLIGSPVNFEIVDSENQNYTKFDNKLKINIPIEIDNIEKNDEFSLKKLAVYYYNEETSSWEYTGGKYNSKTNQISVLVDHLTQFAIMENSKSFIDTKSHWGKDYIEVLASRNIINGINENEFMPDINLTRAQFTTLIVRGLNLDLVDFNNTFKDIKEDDWYGTYIETAVANNIISGYGNGLFKPNENITREEMASIIVKAYLFYNNQTLNDLKLNNSDKFDDYDNISTWAKDSVNAAYNLNFINGITETAFSPKTNSNRAQAAVIIYRLLNSIEII